MIFGIQQLHNISKHRLFGELDSKIHCKELDFPYKVIHEWEACSYYLEPIDIIIKPYIDEVFDSKLYSVTSLGKRSARIVRENKYGQQFQVDIMGEDFLNRIIMDFTFTFYKYSTGTIFSSLITGKSKDEIPKALKNIRFICDYIEAEIIPKFNYMMGF